MQEYHITLLGPTGVGKTSLLTSMYYLFEHANIGIEHGLQLTPELESSAIINRQLEKLKTLQDNFEATGGVASTADEKKFVFELGRIAKTPELKLIFRDFPGGWLEESGKGEQVKEYLKTSEVIIVAIDAAALMETKRKSSYNELINKPTRINDLFKMAFQELEKPKLILFVPVKCETYLQEGTKNRREELLKRIKEEYKLSLRYFETEALSEKIAVAVTPVQTVGNVFFSHIEVDAKNDPSFRFIKKRRHDPYAPKDVEQPLRHMLSFLLDRHLDKDNRSWFTHIFKKIGFNFDQHFKKALVTLADGCK
ncbi:hypothetical protein PN36_32295 [Candidatus Thiomargarita nelsonii]|uniref:Double-GTPase 2 domain-containing protein n=1 Tax=Candidatus Thiomargarita nelsonii TaxID=1003181 RepID=A0A4E0QNN3_9GAMM|nr:hypothetical protein PN36_32295 [Candidatus Thiomargarita nelsonii]